MGQRSTHNYRTVIAVLSKNPAAELIKGSDRLSDSQSSTTRATERGRWERRAVWLAWATVGYNAIEAVVAITSGVAAGSVALVSFGGDSIVECLSALVIVWQFRGLPEEREQAAMKGIALAFFVLAAYITIDSIRSLLLGADPDSSPVGIALAATSLVVMPLLVVAKRRTAGPWGQPLSWPTVCRHSCARTCRRCCWLGWPSMRSWGGRGPTRWRR